MSNDKNLSSFILPVVGISLCVFILLVEIFGGFEAFLDNLIREKSMSSVAMFGVPLSCGLSYFSIISIKNSDSDGWLNWLYLFASIGLLIASTLVLTL